MLEHCPHGYPGGQFCDHGALKCDYCDRVGKDFMTWPIERGRMTAPLRQTLCPAHAREVEKSFNDWVAQNTKELKT